MASSTFCLPWTYYCWNAVALQPHKTSPGFRDFRVIINDLDARMPFEVPLMSRCSMFVKNLQRICKGWFNDETSITFNV